MIGLANFEIFCEEGLKKYCIASVHQSREEVGCDEANDDPNWNICHEINLVYIHHMYLGRILFDLVNFRRY